MENVAMKLTTLVYELEGLLAVLDKHGSDTPLSIVAGIKQKAKEIAVESEQIDLVFNYEPEFDKPVETEPTEGRVVENPMETPPPFVASPDVEDINNGDVHIVEDEQQFMPQPEAQPAPQPVPQAIPQPAPQQDSVPGIRVDEKIGREQAKDLRAAMSLNDRFRFRRELFSNNDIEMNNALSEVGQMATMKEAEDYFYGYWGFDADDMNVKDFMEIIRRHFA